MFNSFNTPVNSWEILKGFPNGNNYIYYSQEVAHLDSNLTPSFQARCEPLLLLKETIPINVRMTEDYDETWWRGLFYTEVTFHRSTRWSVARAFPHNTSQN